MEQQNILDRLPLLGDMIDQNIVTVLQETSLQIS